MPVRGDIKAYRRRMYQKNKALQLRQNKDWRDAHKEERLMRDAKRTELSKEAAINMYSNGEAVCAYCGHGDMDVLCLDHINDDGKTHRQQTGLNRIYAWLCKHDYPKGFQVLCFNCNRKKEVLRLRRVREARIQTIRLEQNR